MKVFHAGMPAWKKAGGLVVTERDAVERWIAGGDSFVLVDLRDAAAAARGFIPGAVNVPAKELASWKGRFPPDKKAPIVLYDEADVPRDAFATVRGWGYSNVSALRGGRAAWTGTLASGAPGRAIAYVKRLAPGAIAIEEFKRIVDARPRGTVVVDVREPPVDGTLPGALAIPESQLAARAKEIPRDRDVVLHCNTGILARRAYELLAANGHPRARYLDAVIVVGASGAYEVTEK